MYVLQQEELVKIYAGLTQEKCADISIFSKIDKKNATQILCYLKAKNTAENIVMQILYISCAFIVINLLQD